MDNGIPAELEGESLASLIYLAGRALVLLRDPDHSPVTVPESTVALANADHDERQVAIVVAIQGKSIADASSVLTDSQTFICRLAVQQLEAMGLQMID